MSLTDKRFSLIVIILYIIRSPRMLADWFKRRVLRINPTGPNPSRWDGGKK